MREKTLKEQEKKEKLKFLAVVLFSLISGILYSYGFHNGSLGIGERIAAEEIGTVKGGMVSAENIMEKIDINTASAEELLLLSGIGEGRGADIVKYREEHGAFSRIEDIMNVPGIGEKTFEEIKERITVGE